MEFSDSVLKRRDQSRTGPRIANMVLGFKKKSCRTHTYSISRIIIKLSNQGIKTNRLVKQNIINRYRHTVNLFMI